MDAGKYSRGPDGYFYHFHEEKLPWDKARKTCSSEAKGAQLPVITNSQTTKFLMSFLPGIRIWTAGTDADREGEWVWTYGDETKRNIIFPIPWGSREPNGRRSENCMMRDPRWGGRFSDLSCDNPTPFFCQLSRKGKERSCDQSLLSYRLNCTFVLS